MLGLRPEHLSFPHQRGSCLSSAPLIIALGTKRGTKSKRPQTVMLTSREEDLVRVLEIAVAATPPGHPLFPYSLPRYRTLLKQAELALGVDAGWGPHSPRAGWATDSRAAGVSFTEIREGGRWVSDSSLRVYLDVLGANTVLQQLQQRGLEPQLRYVSTNWPIYFYQICGALDGYHGAEGIQDDRRRVDEATREPSFLARAFSALGWGELLG